MVLKWHPSHWVIKPELYSSTVKGERPRLQTLYWTTIITRVTPHSHVPRSAIMRTFLHYIYGVRPGSGCSRDRHLIYWCWWIMNSALTAATLLLQWTMVAHRGQFNLHGPVWTWGWKKLTFRISEFQHIFENELALMVLMSFQLYSMCWNILTLTWITLD